MFFQYFIMANFFWLLVEGLYLHTLLVLIFSENRHFIVYLFIGWGRRTLCRPSLCMSTPRTFKGRLHPPGLPGFSCLLTSLLAGGELPVGFKGHLGDDSPVS